VTFAIGLISDTHGLLRAEAVEALRGADLVVHAGDVGDPRILASLRDLAPVVAVRGNVDRGAWADALPETEVVSIGGRSLYVIHDLATLDDDVAALGMHAVVYGHSHQPLIERRGRVLYVNPGSAGPRRFKLPITVARLTIDARGIDAELVPLCREGG
jgi:putative phosphoesterase